MYVAQTDSLNIELQSAVQFLAFWEGSTAVQRSN